MNILNFNSFAKSPFQYNDYSLCQSHHGHFGQDRRGGLLKNTMGIISLYSTSPQCLLHLPPGRSDAIIKWYQAGHGGSCATLSSRGTEARLGTYFGRYYVCLVFMKPWV